MGGTAFEPDVNGNLTLSDKCHVFEQKPHHSFPLPVWGFGILPESGKVTGEGSDSGTLLFIDHGPVVLALLFVPLLRLG